jgi:hypothetical protein
MHAHPHPPHPTLTSHAHPRPAPRSSPIVTGTSVLALKYRDGVMLAADTLGEWTALTRRGRTLASVEPPLRRPRRARPSWHARSATLTPVPPPAPRAPPAGSYGSLARFTNLRRIRRVGDYTLVAGSGEYSDFQYIMDLLHELV